MLIDNTSNHFSFKKQSKDTYRSVEYIQNIFPLSMFVWRHYLFRADSSRAVPLSVPSSPLSGTNSRAPRTVARWPGSQPLTRATNEGRLSILARYSLVAVAGAALWKRLSPPETGPLAHSYTSIHERWRRLPRGGYVNGHSHNRYGHSHNQSIIFISNFTFSRANIIATELLHTLH